MIAFNPMNSLNIIETPAKKTGIFAYMPLHTPRLRIREFQLSDAAALYELHRDFRATRYAGGTRTREESLEALGRIINRARKTGFGSFAVALKDSNEVIGWAGVQPMADLNRFELLYALRPPFWRKGFATEAATYLLNAAFKVNSSAIPEIYALVFPQNIASIRVLEKLGMVFAEDHFDKPTQRYACLYSISASEFTRRQTLPREI